MDNTVKQHHNLPLFTSYITEERSMTNHFHTLHQRQTYSLVTRQADDTGRSVRGGLHQGDHCLHTQSTALKTCIHPGLLANPDTAAAFPTNYLPLGQLCLPSTHESKYASEVNMANQYSVKCWWSSSALNMAQYCESGIVAQPFDHQLKTDKHISEYSAFVIQQENRK